tara:strand:- start:238 stop:717 length:480 start_codon:yes stop_codon:yes gene_type:complete
MNIKNTLQLLNIKEVTSSRQKSNGTREFKLPIKSIYGNDIYVASYSTGYVRRTKVRSCWQLNKTKMVKEYVTMNDHDTGRPVIRTFQNKERVLIANEQERLEYLIAYCLKNYYIGQANMLSNGDYTPKWELEYKLKEAIDENTTPEVKVIVNGHRYNVI